MIDFLVALMPGLAPNNDLEISFFLTDYLVCLLLLCRWKGKQQTWLRRSELKERCK